MSKLPEMTPGGVWLQRDSQEPIYVVHEAHIKRCTSEGWRLVEDPRREPEAAGPQPPSMEDQLQEALRQLAELKAQFGAQRLSELPQLLKESEQNAATDNDERLDSTRAPDDSRPDGSESVLSGSGHSGSTRRKS